MQRIIIFIPYFGKFPEWSDLFFETLKRNKTIDFLFYTDCEIEKYEAPNIHYVKLSFQEYVDKVNEHLDFSFTPENAYKICDIRPLFGTIHKDDFKEYEFYGWCDMDLIFGDIRSFYTNELLNSFDVFTTHDGRMSGHFSLFRNNVRNREIYKSIYKWQDTLKKPHFIGMDEHGLNNAYQMTVIDKFNEKFNRKIDNWLIRKIKARKIRRLYMREQYSTPFIPFPWIDGSLNSNQPDEWYYVDGAITNNRDGDRKFMYLHFMNFKSSQWRHDGTKAPWEEKKTIFTLDLNKKIGKIVINSIGISGM
ncbi:MAG: hypothetical protein HRT57_03120 [Crocinitomicaceae bacterium]|nr:hypothetical protein [Crocinitomicaceae bacterium]